ncbi:MAG: GNAT family N-acetyltransferase [Candidatus Rokuibacteriota bacterium]
MKVLRGLAAVRGDISAERRAEWQRLAAAEDKVTVFHEPGFVLTWYDVYEPEHEPLLLIGLDELDRLMGVMPLAVPRGTGGSLAFAGAEQAEYAGWLARPEIAREFPTRCILELRELGLFSRPWRWKWLAPGSDVEGLASDVLREHGLAVRFSRTQKPLWTVQGPKPVRFAVDNRKVNRLKRQGEVRLVQLDSATMTEDLFGAFTTTHDVRELQIRGLDPFRTSPLKGIFHQRLVDRAPDSVLFFALMVGPVPVAFSFNLRDRRRIIFCLDAFDPRWAASSPGKLINNLVADALATRGIQAIDLTPGGDAYKEEVANDSEAIYSVVLFPGTAQARVHDLKALAERGGKRTLRAMGLSPARARGLTGLARRLATGGLIRDGMDAGRRWAASREALAQYQLDRGDGVAARPQCHPTVRTDAIGDFLLYSGAGRARSRQGMMQEVLSRVRRGQRCYTVIADGRLVGAGWLESDAKGVSVGADGFEWPLPPKTARLHVVDPEVEGAAAIRRSLVRRMTGEAFAAGAERVVVLVGPREGSLVETLEAVGFCFRRRLVSQRRLGRVRRLDQAV